MNKIKTMEESFPDGVNLLYKASGSEQAQMVDSGTPFRTETLIAQNLVILSDESS